MITRMIWGRGEGGGGISLYRGEYVNYVIGTFPVNVLTDLVVYTSYLALDVGKSAPGLMTSP